jgi:hypothetical protein
MRRIVSLVVGLGLAACGGGDGGSSGTVENPSGAALTVTGSLPLSASNFAVVNGNATCQLTGAVTFGVAYAAMIASDQTGICGYLQRNQNKANARSVDVAIVRIDPSNPSTSIAPGTYPVVPNPTVETAYAFLQVSQTDASCAPSDVPATGGSVVVTSVANGGIQGTIDATLTDGGKITGAFDAPACAVTFPGDVCGGTIGPVNPTCAP